MVNALEENVSPLPAGTYGKATTQSTRRLQQVNEWKRGWEAEIVRALEALSSLQSNRKLEVEKRQETNLLSNEQKQKQMKDNVERETAVARTRIQDAERPIMHEPKDMTTADSTRVTTRKPETTFEEMLNTMRDSLSDLVASDDEQDGEDKEHDVENTAFGKLSDD
jgi:hypothetical protein